MSELKTILSAPLKIVRVEQNSPEWLALRRKFRTASETPSVLGLSPWTTAAQLAATKFAKNPPPQEENAAMAHGHTHEDAARKLYEREFGCKMPPSVVTRGPYLASLDGWSKDRQTVLEIKAPFQRRNGHTWRVANGGALPDHYEAQVAHQLLVSGSRLARFWVYDSDTQEALRVDVRREQVEHWFPVIHDAWEQFYRRYA